uniref:Cytochrome c oxidase assembly factor 4 homolog n=1 Tax=Strigops habroptila TaxID=2489341 RepID=A0A672VAQ9_STRHB
MEGAEPGHGRSRAAPEEDEDEEDPVDALVARTGCMAQHRALQHCMAERQDWRHCQPHVRAFRDCMAQRKQDREPGRAPSSSQGHPAPAAE